jgi:hypothetical protein
MFDFFKFIFSWKFILLAVVTFFLGKPLVDNLLSQAESEATQQEEAIKKDIDEFDLEEVEGIADKVKGVAETVKEKIALILEQLKDKLD